MERVDSEIPTISTVTSDYTVRPQDEYIPVDASGGAVIITLIPSNTKNKGKQYEISKRDSSAYTVTLTGDGTDTINGASTLVISFQNSTAHIVADGVGGWGII